MWTLEDIDAQFSTRFAGLSMSECLLLAQQLTRTEVPKLKTNKDVEQIIALSEDANNTYIELLRRISEDLFPLEPTPAFEYALQLLYRAISEDNKKFSLSLQKIRKISEERFPNSEDFARLYATGLKFMLDKQDRCEQEKTIESIWELYNKYDKDDFIKTCYEEGYAKIGDNECVQGHSAETDKNVNSESRTISPPQIINTLTKLYVGYSFQLDSDPFFCAYFEALYTTYPALFSSDYLLEFVPIKSNKGKIITLVDRNKKLYSIIWDSSYWRLFEVFCWALTLLDERRIRHWGLFVEEPAVEVCNSVLYELYTYLSKCFFSSDSQLSNWCQTVANKYEQIRTVVFSNKAVGAELVEIGKIYVLHHELEHIFYELDPEAEDNTHNYSNFQLLLQAHSVITTNVVHDNEMIHDFSKADYLDRMTMLIEGTGNWKSLQMELFYDWGAFSQMVFRLQDISKMSEKDAIITALVGSKVYNMFRTWLHIARCCVEEGSFHKRQGLSPVDCMKAIYDADIEDEIEFRQVINHRLCMEGLQLFRSNEVFSEQDYNLYNSCVDPFISIYQNYFVPLNKSFQTEFFIGFLNNTEEE